MREQRDDGAARNNNLAPLKNSVVSENVLFDTYTLFLFIAGTTCGQKILSGGGTRSRWEHSSALLSREHIQNQDRIFN